MATFQGTPQTDLLVGTGKSGDVFLFDEEDFNYNDKIVGGGALQSPLDRLILTSGGYAGFNQYYDNGRSRITGIEILELSNQGNYVRVPLEFINQTSSGRLDVYGGDGDDYVIYSFANFGTQPKNTVVSFYGGDGDDFSDITLFAHDKAYGGTGDDVLSGGAGYLDGGTGNDRLSSYRAATILGGEGDDILQGGAGSTLDGGDGIDYVVAVDDTVLPTDVTLLNIEGIAIKRIVCTIDALSPFTNIKGIEPYNYLNQAYISLVGGGTIDFNDFVIDADKLFVGLFGSEEVYDVTAGATPTSIIGGLNTDHLKGGTANDELDGERGDDILEGGGGDDRLTGGRGSDVLHGGGGNDYFEVEIQVPDSGTATYDEYFGEEGNDTFNLFGPVSGPITGMIDGGTGIDTIVAGWHGDVSLLVVKNVEILIGSLDNRYIRLTEDTFANVDVIDLGMEATNSAAYMRVAAIGGGVFDLRGKMKDTDEGVQFEVWSDHDFKVLGTGFGDRIFAGSGHDEMFGRGGNDSFFTGQSSNQSLPDLVYGNAGNDSFYYFYNGESLFGGAGNDTFYQCFCNASGGKGYDTFHVEQNLRDGSYKSIEALVVASTLLSATAAALAQFKSIEFLYLNGSQGVLRVQGSEYFDLSSSSHGYALTSPEAATGLNFKASNFTDNIELTAFDDSVDAAGGDDFIYGGLGNDTIAGGAGNDRIIGHFGSDSMSGGSGNDIFYYDDVMLEPDYITDFETGIDILQFDYGVPLGRNASGYGDLKSKYFQSSASNVAANNDVRFIYDTTDGSLYLDVDGSKSSWAPILIAVLTNKPVLVADDIYMS